MPRVVSFQMSAVHPDRAMRFYGDVFGWTFTRWDSSEERWLVETGPNGEPGINGNLVQHRSPPATPADLTILTIGVDSIDEMLSRILGAGGEVVGGKQPVEGVGYMATFRDPEGNILALQQTHVTE